jgi:hypothetical protein
MPWIGINKTIRKTVAYIILLKNRTWNILFTQNENKIFFRILPFWKFENSYIVSHSFNHNSDFTNKTKIQLYHENWWVNNVTIKMLFLVLELSWQIGKWRHNDIISYVIKDCHSGHFVAKQIRNRTRN